MDSPALTRILGNDCCTGCGICAAVSDGAIAMEISPTGFLRPKLVCDITTEADRLIADICPGMVVLQEAREGTNHPLWGPIVAARTGGATDERLRHHASSGGALSAVLNYLLESGTVDCVVQIAAAERAPIQSAVVKSVRPDDVFRAAGSRYAPSAPLQGLEGQLARPERFALVGKPCDIAAVRTLARRDKRVSEKIPVLLSFFCAGVPSLHGTRQILDELEVAEMDVTSFRYRGDGWPGKAAAQTRDGREASMSYGRSWGDILSKHVQFRCKICPDGSGGSADLVFGDAWHCDTTGYPLFEDRPGRSLIISRTAAGEMILGQAVAAGYLRADPLDIAHIELMQPAQARRKRLVLSRILAMAVLGHSVPQFRGLKLANAAISAGLWANLRSFLGMVRRLLA